MEIKFTKLSLVATCLMSAGLLITSPSQTLAAGGVNPPVDQRQEETPVTPSKETAYQKTFDSIIFQNSIRSTANNDICIKGKMFCFSGLLNLDFRYFDRRGDVVDPDLQATNGFPIIEPPSSPLGVGVRPLYGSYENNYIGSFNNLNLFVDGQFYDWIKLHINIVYNGGASETRTFEHEQVDWGSAYQESAALKLDEGYILFSNPDRTPFYFQVGRQYSDFGHYELYPMAISLPQLISQQRTGGAKAGFILQNGLYGSAMWYMAEQSADNVREFVGYQDRNYGLELGYKKAFGEHAVNFNLDYTYDIRDADYLIEGHQFYDDDIISDNKFGPFFAGQSYRMERQGGIAVHFDWKYRNVGVSADYVAALGQLNQLKATPVASDIGPITRRDLPGQLGKSRIQAWSVDPFIDFKTLGGFDSTFTFSVQGSEDAQVFEHSYVPGGLFGGAQPTTNPAINVDIGNVIPRLRLQATYLVHVYKNIIVAAQWARDKDYSKNDNGTGKTSDLATLRFGMQF